MPRNCTRAILEAPLRRGPNTQYTVEELRQCLRDMMEPLDNAYIVVDALDACINDRASVLEMLHSLNDYQNDSIKTLYTGRDEFDIQQALTDYTRLAIAADSNEIRLYIDSEIVRRTKGRSLRIRDPALKEEIRERLVTKAEGKYVILLQSRNYAVIYNSLFLKMRLGCHCEKVLGFSLESVLQSLGLGYSETPCANLVLNEKTLLIRKLRMRIP